MSAEDNIEWTGGEVQNDVAVDGSILHAEDYNKLTVAQLKERLTERGLPVGGNKPDLIARLIESDSIERPAEGMEGDTHEGYQEGDVEVALLAMHDDEMQDGNGEAEEFVEWNEDPADVDGVTEHGVTEEHADGAGVSAETAADEATDSKAKATTGLEEGDTKLEEVDFAVDVSKDKDLFHLKWYGKKIVVPLKAEINQDVAAFSKLQTVVMYPVELTDLQSELVQKYMLLASHIVVETDCIKPGSPTVGYLKMRFAALGDATAAAEELKEFKEGITVRHFCSREDSESHIMSGLKKEKEGVNRKGPMISRLLFVGNLASDVTEASLKELFADALQVIVPCDAETKERSGYAYMEYATEAEAQDASNRFKDTEINGEKLYVIKAIAETKEKFGLLRDTLRRYWLEQMLGLRKTIEKSKSNRDIREAEQKLQILKRRIEQDNKRRGELHIPIPECPEELKVEEKKEAEGGEKSADAADKDKSSSPSRRRSPTRRGGGGDRGHYQQRRGFRGRNRSPVGYSRREEVADKLVNQLQGIVTALAYKLPERDPLSAVLDRYKLPEPPRSGYPRPGTYYEPPPQLLPSYTPLSRYDFERQDLGGYKGGERSGTRRYREDDDYPMDRKRRNDSFDDAGTSSRYGGGARSGYSADDRYGDRRPQDNSGRSYNRSKQQHGNYNNY